jgi:hypothetical protein
MCPLWPCPAHQGWKNWLSSSLHWMGLSGRVRSGLWVGVSKITRHRALPSLSRPLGLPVPFAPHIINAWLKIYNSPRCICWLHSSVLDQRICERKLGSICCFIIFICISLVLVNKNCHLWYNYFIALLIVHLCSVALLRAKELQKCHLLQFMNLFMNKTNESNLILILKLDWKPSNTTPKDPMCVLWNVLVSWEPCYFSEFNIFIYINMCGVTIKKNK